MNLLLDIDGVLNNRHTLSSASFDVGTRFPNEWWDPRFTWVDRKNIEVLNKIVGLMPDCRIIATSTWRRDWSSEALTRILQSEGFEYVVHENAPLFSNVYSRSAEIYLLLPTLQGRSLILDDAEVDYLPDTAYHIRPFSDEGLTEEHFREAENWVRGIR